MMVMMFGVYEMVLEKLRYHKVRAAYSSFDAMLLATPLYHPMKDAGNDDDHYLHRLDEYHAA